MLKPLIMFEIHDYDNFLEKTANCEKVKHIIPLMIIINCTINSIL